MIPSKSGRKGKADFMYAHMYVLAQEVRESRLTNEQKELLAAFLARVFKRRVIKFDLDNFMAICLGLHEGKYASLVHDSFINGCICQKRERCDIPVAEVSESSTD